MGVIDATKSCRSLDASGSRSRWGPLLRSLRLDSLAMPSRVYPGKGMEGRLLTGQPAGGREVGAPAPALHLEAP